MVSYLFSLDELRGIAMKQDESFASPIYKEKNQKVHVNCFSIYDIANVFKISCDLYSEGGNFAFSFFNRY